ncbi:hypothetical protein RRG08_065930 [Elysia crispata]|uniref:Uncharacterized protein n=1 Tax=Elysia crispata TaxID=231223 RepID=A0AAE0ZGR9_9GAST|nr:hypothetical protein RRG08_065930 [Elysia crispata]
MEQVHAYDRSKSVSKQSGSVAMASKPTYDKALSIILRLSFRPHPSRRLTCTFLICPTCTDVTRHQRRRNEEILLVLHPLVIKCLRAPKDRSKCDTFLRYHGLGDGPDIQQSRPGSCDRWP